MIKIDASNVIPKRLGTYLLGLIPGLVFELTVAFGDPALARQMIEQVKQVYPFQAYVLLLLFAASCLVIGQTFFLLAWFKTFTFAVFVSKHGRAIPYSTINQTFLHLARSAGLRPGPGLGGCRIQDLRHTFAVRSLERCGGGS